jgi:hypothetical protein
MKAANVEYEIQLYFGEHAFMRDVGARRSGR